MRWVLHGNRRSEGPSEMFMIRFIPFVLASVVVVAIAIPIISWLGPLLVPASDGDSLTAMKCLVAIVSTALACLIAAIGSFLVVLAICGVKMLWIYYGK